MILGLDLSIASTGWAVYCTSTKKIVDYGVIKTKKSGDNTPQRLREIRNELMDISTKHDITEIVLERGFGRFNTATQQLYRVHGIVNELFADKPQTYYPPASIKKFITGNGRANKGEMVAKVNELVGKSIKSDDICDAIAIILTHMG